MSRTKLKKSLASFGEPELRQLIFDIYDKNKDVRELLDFYAEPDLDRKLDEYEQRADKEIFRVRRRAHRPRMSEIRRLIARFKSFEPGDEYIGRLRLHIAISLAGLGATDFLPRTVNESAEKFLIETVGYLAEHNMLADSLPRLSKAADNMRPKIGLYDNPLRSSLKRIIEDYSGK
ncbi:MAG: hypothetical protein K2H05_06525 [Duncaniella sp.]|nr:hypothetical protein [Duncaniella sp.]